MKRSVAITSAMLTILVLVAAISGCATSKLTSFGWAKFQVPDGYVQVDDLVDCVTISTSSDTDPLNFRLDERTIRLGPKVRQETFPDAKTFMEGTVDQSSGVEIEVIEAGDYVWYVAPFTFKDEQDSVYGYADVNDEQCVGFTAYYMSIDDPDLMTVLETLQVNESKLP
ncbi:MAG: hypothetical protein J5804_00265 [Eggerthellaceae bacterium]|nr:hypothetical protein [Eggerthellaceae bacterium]